MSGLNDEVVRHLQDALGRPEFADDRWEITRRLGQGGMGVVWLARDRTLDRFVAIKVMHAPCGDDRIRDRLEREAKTIARLEHPGIVPIHDAGVTIDSRPYYVMKRVDGRMLDLAAQATPSLNDRLRLFLRLCEVVAYAHDRGIVHRDLKPANIMVGTFGELFVMDWGIAKVDGAPALPSLANSEGSENAGRESAATDTQDGAVLGTPQFMSPEQARGDSASADRRSDIYALGAVLKTLVDCGPSKSNDGDATRSLRPLRAVIARAMAPAPSDRYAEVQALSRDIAAFLDQQPLSAYRESFLERLNRVLNRNRFVVFLILGYLILRAIIAIFVHS